MVKKDKEFQLDIDNSTFAFVSKGNYIEIDGIEYYISAIKSTFKNDKLISIKAKLTIDSSKF